MDNVSTYSFNGSEALAESREDYLFHECFECGDGSKEYLPVDVTDVRVVKVEPGQDETNKKAVGYCLTVKCFSEASGEYTLRYDIARKQYLSFINEKKVGDFRLKLLLRYTKGDLFVRKAAGKHIDVRMSTELYNEIHASAKSCKMKPSSYIRDVMKGKRPRAAFTKEEFEIMSDFVKVYHNYLNFFNAAKGFMKDMTPEQKLNFLIEGMAYREWRKFLVDGLPVMKRLIDGSRMRLNNTWHDAQGKKLPKIGREVIVLIQSGDESLIVGFGYRPNPKAESTYDMGKWNQPNVKYWLDVELPKGDNELED